MSKRNITLRFIAVICICACTLIMLTGCNLPEQGDWPPKGWKQSDYGSFSPDITTSYDGKYFAVQTLDKPEGYGQNYIRVTIYDSENKSIAESFLTERAFDFWGICWEPDSYNIWIQSSDVGTYCMCFEDGHWSRDVYGESSVVYKDGKRYVEATHPHNMPDGMIDRYRIRNGSFEYNNAYSADGLYFAGKSSFWDESIGAWISCIEICEMEDGKSIYIYPLIDGEYSGVCWEREQNNLWVRLNDSVFCLQYKDGNWIRNDSMKRPDYIALAYNWDGTIKE